MLWVYPTTVIGGQWYSIASINNDGFDSYEDLAILDSSPNKFGIAVGAAGSWLGDNASSITPSANTWYHLAMVRESGTSLKLYVNGTLELTETDSVAARGSATRFEVGAFTSSNFNPYAGRVAGIKVWETGLTLAEVLQEMHTLRPQRFANLSMFTPCFPASGERTRDYSGNGRDWTEVGTLTDEDPPPVSYGGRTWFLPYTAGTTIYNITPSGSVSGAGVLGKWDAKPTAGAVTSSGALARGGAKPVAGALTGTGVTGRQAGKVVSGSTTSAGALGRDLSMSLGGSLMGAGALVKAILLSAYLASLAAPGALFKQTQKILPGSATGSGTLAAIKIALLNLAGDLTPSGALVRDTVKTLAGSATTTGAHAKAIARTYAGALTGIGMLLKDAAAMFAGALTGAGALTTIKVALLTLTGALSPAGALGRDISNLVAGTVTGTGALYKSSAAFLAGTLIRTGVVLRSAWLMPGGSLTGTGAVGFLRVLDRLYAGALTGAGALGRDLFKTLTGAVTGAGGLVKAAARQLAGALTPTGALSILASGAITALRHFSLAARSFLFSLAARSFRLTLAPRARGFTLATWSGADMTSRAFMEGTQRQGADETIVYALTTTPWGSSPTSVEVKVFDVTNGFGDVTSAVMPTGAPSVSGDIITLPALTALTALHLYRIEVKFTSSGNVFEAFGEIRAER